MEAYLSVRNVSKSFDGKRAVEDVSFEVGRGEVYGLLGPNGAGKTTLMSMIAGILEPDSGEISVGGLSPLNPGARSRIGYCPQEAVIYENLTGLENLAFYSGLHGLSGGDLRRRCVELLELVGLRDHADRRVKEYSGGMRRRLSFAISLIGDPELMLLDEPTIGMDPGMRRAVWSLVKGLRDEGKTIILATHYMDEADELSDRVAIMDRGRIIAEGSPEDLKKAYGPKAVIGIELAESKPTLDDIRSHVGGEVVYEADNVLKVHVEDPDEAVPKLVSTIIRKGAKLQALRIMAPSLEDVFLRLTGRRLKV